MSEPKGPSKLAAIVDEYNDILAAICGYTTLVSAELAPWNPCQRDLDQINVAVERAAEVTKRLASADFARDGSGMSRQSRNEPA